MLNPLLTAATVLALATAPALAAEAVDGETLQEIVDLYKTEFGQSTAGALPLRDPAEIRPGGWTDKWDEKAERSVEAHRKLILEPSAAGAVPSVVPEPVFGAETVDRETLRDIVEMYKTRFNQSTTGKLSSHDPAEIRPGGWTEKWNETAEASVQDHRNRILRF